MEKMVSRGHRSNQWVVVSNQLVATRETLGDFAGDHSPFICLSAGGPHPRGAKHPVCLYAAWPPAPADTSTMRTQ